LETRAGHKKVFIIGGGLSGVLVAVYLAGLKNGTEIVLVEKIPEKLGRGVAYQQDFINQPLNVVAGSMSLYEDAPDDFVNWLKGNAFRYSNLIAEISPRSFVPRKIFGDYVTEKLKEAHSSYTGKFQIIIDEAICISKKTGGHSVLMASGIEHYADHVVLALGNFPPGDIAAVTDEIKHGDSYFSNSWTDKIYKDLSGNEEILLIGSGLTAIDVVLGLHIRNFKGKVTMVSRRGRLPLSHFFSDRKFLWNLPYRLCPLELLKLVRQTIKSNPEIHWSLIVDALRVYVPEIWTYWDLSEKKLFLKRLRPFWEISRHRIPEESLTLLTHLQCSDQLRVIKGEVLKIQRTGQGFDILYRNGNITENKSFHKIINCTGPESNYRKIKFPIIDHLIHDYNIVPDPLNLGILCNADGKMMNEKGQPIDGLWCIGPMRKAVLWETTALREIRSQACRLAKDIGG